MNEILAKKFTILQPNKPPTSVVTRQPTAIVNKQPEKHYQNILKSAIENSYQRAQPIKTKDFPCIYLDCPYRFTFQNIEQHLNDAHNVTKIKVG